MAQALSIPFDRTIPEMTFLAPNNLDPQAGPSRPRRRPVILFKSPSPGSPAEPDPYGSLLLSEGYDPIFLPVLTETYHTEELKNTVQDGGKHWQGVIIMSRRGAGAWLRAGKEILTEGGGPKSGWEDVPLFCVGSAARDELDRDYGIPPGMKPNTSDTCLTGKTALELADVVLRQPPRTDPHPSKPQSQSGSSTFAHRPYLVLQGDKSLGQLQESLMEAGRQVHLLDVYETTEDPNFTAHLQQTLGELDTLSFSARQGGKRKEVWLTFFAPSSAGMALEHLRKLNDVEGLFRVTLDRADEAASHGAEVEGGEEKGMLRVFAIGETTKAFLIGQGVTVAAMAETPSAEAMLTALRIASVW